MPEEKQSDLEANFPRMVSCAFGNGYRLTTVHPKFGEVSSVFSFRNVSNGYYGGWIEPVDLDVTKADQIKLTDDEVGS